MWSKGICWIDDCRIPFVDEKDKDKNTNGLSRFIEYRGKLQELGYGFNGGESYNINTQGRFPANILVSDDVLNDGVISKSQKGIRIIEGRENVINPSGWKEVNRTSGKISGFNDKGTNSRYYDIDKWFDKLLDE